MGCNQSTPSKVFNIPRGGKVDVPTESAATLSDSKLWKRKKTKAEAKRFFIQEGTLSPDSPPELLEFREFLDEPHLLKTFGEYTRTFDDLKVLKCWVDVLEFKCIDESCTEMAYGKAYFIFQTYLVENAEECLPSQLQDPAWVAQLDEILSRKNSAETIPTSLFDKFQQQCLSYLGTKHYDNFKLTPSFKASSKELKEKYNCVTTDDFEYFGKLGQGGFGFVVECRKKSTNMRYAMKIQSKIGLLDCFSDCPERVICEKQAMIACHHPFIVSMDYAFQTRALVVMVLDLCTAGTLSDALMNSWNGKLSEERVRFYSAEIILALAHIHRMGLIYRDLKPANVLLNADGHIQLVDMGGIVDVTGNVLGYHKVSEEGDGLFAPNHPRLVTESSISARDEVSKYGQENSATGSISGNKAARDPRSGADKKSTSTRHSHATSMSRSSYKQGTGTTARATSVMGTQGFMAPEILALECNPKIKGYTASVDFWSLGVTMYKLLTGRLPLDKVCLVHFAKIHNFTDKTSEDYQNLVSQYDAHLEKLFLTRNISEECSDFIRKLLHLNGDARLGSGGKKGIMSVKNHSFFQGLSWRKVLQKQVDPPMAGDQWEGNDATAFPDLPRMGERSKVPCEKSRMMPNGIACEIETSAAGTDFTTMIENLNKESLLFYQPTNKEQVLFATWDFISPSILKKEMGLMMGEFERNRAGVSLLHSFTSTFVRNFSSLKVATSSEDVTAHSDTGNRQSSFSIPQEHVSASKNLFSMVEEES